MIYRVKCMNEVNIHKANGKILNINIHQFPFIFYTFNETNDKQIEAGYDGQHSLVGTPRQSHYCGKVLCWAWLGTVQQKDYCWM